MGTTKHHKPITATEIEYRRKLSSEKVDMTFSLLKYAADNILKAIKKTKVLKKKDEQRLLRKIKNSRLLQAKRAKRAERILIKLNR